MTAGGSTSSSLCSLGGDLSFQRAFMSLPGLLSASLRDARGDSERSVEVQLAGTVRRAATREPSKVLGFLPTWEGEGEGGGLASQTATCSPALVSCQLSTSRRLFCKQRHATVDTDHTSVHGGMPEEFLEFFAVKMDLGDRSPQIRRVGVA